MKNNLYFIERYVRCGAVPLYLIFYRNRGGAKGHYAMLCTIRNLRKLLKEYKGFISPDSYGRVIYKGREAEPSEVIKYILKSRYDFDLEKLNGNESVLF